MAKVYGKDVTKDFLLQRVGDISQLAGVQASRLSGGKAGDMECLDVWTGSGLNFTVLPDRALDIGRADFKGISLGYITSVGMVGSKYFHEEGEKGFLKNFFAGLLTTGGLLNIGVPCVDGGEALGLHGSMSNVPAEDVCVNRYWEGDEYRITIRGRIRQSRFKGENLVLTRSISTALGSREIVINDQVENLGFVSQPISVLYHINFGFPIVSEDSQLHIPETKVRPRTEEARRGIDSYSVFQVPTPGYSEQVFYHSLASSAEGNTYACLYNPSLGDRGLGGCVKFNTKQLPILTEWKEMGQGAYVVGLEPCNTHLEGRDVLRREGNLQQIEPGEVRNFDVAIAVIDGKDELAALRIG